MAIELAQVSGSVAGAVQSPAHVEELRTQYSPLPELSCCTALKRVMASGTLHHAGAHGGTRHTQQQLARIWMSAWR